MRNFLHMFGARSLQNFFLEKRRLYESKDEIGRKLETAMPGIIDDVMASARARFESVEPMQLRAGDLQEDTDVVRQRIVDIILDAEALEKDDVGFLVEHLLAHTPVIGDIRNKALRKAAQALLQTTDALNKASIHVLREAALSYSHLRQPIYLRIFNNIRFTFAMRGMKLSTDEKDWLAEAALFLSESDAEEAYQYLEQTEEEDAFTDIFQLLAENDSALKVGEYYRIFQVPLRRLIDELEPGQILGLFKKMVNLPFQKTKLPSMRNAYMRKHLSREVFERLVAKIEDPILIHEVVSNLQAFTMFDFDKLGSDYSNKIIQSFSIGEEFTDIWSKKWDESGKSPVDIYQWSRLQREYETMRTRLMSSMVAVDFDGFDKDHQTEMRDSQQSALSDLREIGEKTTRFIELEVNNSIDENTKNQATELKQRIDAHLRFFGSNLERILAIDDTDLQEIDEEQKRFCQHIKYQTAALDVASGSEDDEHALNGLRSLEDGTVFNRYHEDEHGNGAFVDVPKNEIEGEAIPPKVTELIGMILRHARAARDSALNNPFQDPVAFAKEWGYATERNRSGQPVRSPLAEEVLAQPHTALKNADLGLPPLESSITLPGTDESHKVVKISAARTDCFAAKAIIRDQHLNPSDGIQTKIEFYIGPAEKSHFYHSWQRLKSVKGAIAAHITDQVGDLTEQMYAHLAESVEAENTDIKVLADEYRQLREQAREKYNITSGVKAGAEHALAGLQRLCDLADTPFAKAKADDERASSANALLMLAKRMHANLKEIIAIASDDPVDMELDDNAATRLRAKLQKIEEVLAADDSDAQEYVGKANALVHEFEIEERLNEQVNSIADAEQRASQKEALRMELTNQIEVRNAGLNTFALWIISTLQEDKMLSDEKKTEFKTLVGQDAKPIIRIVDDRACEKNDVENLKGNEKAKFIPTDTGFEIVIRASVWNSADVGSILRHEGLHAIDQATMYRLSSVFYAMLQDNGAEFDTYFAEFTEHLARVKKVDSANALSDEEKKREFFVSLLSETPLSDDAEVIRKQRVFRDKNQQLIDRFYTEHLLPAAENFAQNGVKAGWGEPMAYAVTEDVTDVDLDEKRNPETYRFQFNQRRRRMLNKLNTIKKFKGIPASDRKEAELFVNDILDHWTTRMNEHGLGEREKDRDENFTAMMGFLKDAEGVLDQILAKIAFDYSEQESVLRELWNNTTFLALCDFKTLFATTKDFIERRHERNSKRRAGKAGKALLEHIPYLRSLGNEFENVNQKAELDSVNDYKDKLTNMDSWQVMERVESCANQDELKACLYLLSDRGAIDWNDRRLWRAFERYQGMIKFIDTDSDNPEFLRNKFQRACGILYDDDFFRDIDRKNSSSFESTKREFEEETNQNSYIIDNIINQMLLDKRNQRKKVSPHRFEMYLDKAIAINKGNPEQCFWWILQGVNYGLMTMERVVQFDTKVQNAYSMTNWFTNVRPNVAQIRAIANMFEPDAGGGMPEEFMDWFQTEVLGNKAVQERTLKLTSDSNLDHDWAFILGSIGNSGTAQQLLATNAGMKPRVPQTGIPNIAAGQLLRFTAIAREYKADKIQNRTYLREQIAKQIEYSFSYQAILTGRLNDSYANSFVRDTYRASSGDLDSTARMGGVYLGSGGGKPKTCQQYLDANIDIIAALDPKLFEIVGRDKQVAAHMDEINQRLRELGYPEKELPKDSVDFIKNLGGIARMIMSNDDAANKKGTDNALDRIMDAAILQYEKDHPNERPKDFIGRYDYSDIDMNPPRGFPKHQGGMWGTQ